MKHHGDKYHARQHGIEPRATDGDHVVTNAQDDKHSLNVQQGRASDKTDLLPAGVYRSLRKALALGTPIY